MTYTFTMKDGLKWSDGEALDANDVLYSWNRLADENTAADYSYLCSVFATKDDGTLDIEASEDGKTFTAHLNAPCAYSVSYTHLDVYKRQGMEELPCALEIVCLKILS